MKRTCDSTSSTFHLALGTEPAPKTPDTNTPSASPVIRLPKARTSNARARDVPAEHLDGVPLGSDAQRSGEVLPRRHEVPAEVGATPTARLAASHVHVGRREPDSLLAEDVLGPAGVPTARGWKKAGLSATPPASSTCPAVAVTAARAPDDSDAPR